MHFIAKLMLFSLVLTGVNSSIAQTDDSELLKQAAVEALISAPPERALPLVKKILAGNASDDLKTRAMFILSQIDLPEAQLLLLETARNGSGEPQLHAIRMIGIGGDSEAMAGLAEIYKNGDRDIKESILGAYMIAGDNDAVFRIANEAATDEEFEQAVNMLAAMGATDQLHNLRERVGSSESLIHAYAIAGDYERLRELALDGSNPEQQMYAIHGLGIVGGDEVGTTLMEIYRNSDSEEVREQAMHGMLIAGHAEGVVELFRESDSSEEKGELLRLLVMMDNDLALQIIDETLGGDL